MLHTRSICSLRFRFQAATVPVEASLSRFKRVIGDALRSRTDRRRTTEIVIAIQALNRMLELGRPKSVRIA